MKAHAQPQVKPAPSSSFTHARSGLLQRKCACGGTLGLDGECAECRRKRLTLQRRPFDQAEPSAAPPIVHDVLNSPGQPLDANTRTFMEPRLGYDFSQVRVHTDTRAAASARTIDAVAYTVGHHVVLPGDTESVAVGDGRVLAHELAHVVQQRGGDTSDTPQTISAPDTRWECEADSAAEAVTAGRSFRPTQLTGPALQRQAPPPPPPTLTGLSATRVAFNNAGAPDGANCAPALPAALGVDGPEPGANGMEMIFRIHGAIPADTEFDITRTRATGTWERDAAGAWTRLGGDPAGTSDDHHDDDECLTPVARRIFVIDTPGVGALDPRGPPPFGDGTVVAAAATAAVRKHSFAEWVIARNRPLGIDWVPISSPLFHRWHSVISVESVGGVWTRVDTPSGQHNEIELGSIATTGPTP